MELHVGEGVSQGASRRHGPSCRAEAQRCGGGSRRGSRGAGTGRGGGRGGEGVAKDSDRHRGAGGLQDHGAGDPEALLLVRFEHVGEAEALAAHLARVRLLASVGAAVALHVGPAGEALPTNLTNERLLSCTDEGKKKNKTDV